MADPARPRNETALTPEGGAPVPAIIGVRQAARMLLTDPHSVRRMIKAGTLHANTSSGVPRIRRADVEDVIAAREMNRAVGGRARDLVAARQARVLALFDAHTPLTVICTTECMRVEAVLALARLWCAGLPYEEPKVPPAPASAVVRSAKSIALEERAERDAAAAHDARMSAFDAELAAQREAAEREHERAMKRRREA